MVFFFFQLKSKKTKSKKKNRNPDLNFGHLTLPLHHNDYSR